MDVERKTYLEQEQMKHLEHPLIKEEKVEARLYQQEITKNIIDKGNSLVVLPTALGKTIIAVMVAAHQLKNNNKKLLFLAPTKPLVNQHKKSFEELTNIDKLAVLTGETKKRKQKWEKSKAVFATPQTIESALFSGQINLSEVALITFDEAHRATGDYAYVFLADRFKRESDGLVLALTASPGGTKEKIKKVCENLYVTNVETKTEEDSSVEEYTYNKSVSFEKVELPGSIEKIKELLEERFKNVLKEMKEKNFVTSVSKKKWMRKKKLLQLRKKLLKMKSKKKYYGLSLVAELMKLAHSLDLLTTQGIGSLEEYMKKLKKEAKETKASKRLVSTLKFRKAFHLVKESDEEHPKLDKLMEILEEDDGQTIVFSNYRTTVSKIVEKLHEKGISSKKFVGQSTKGGKKGLKQKEQLERIKEFENKDFQVLVSTSVGEEGLDIPNVDTVIFYEPVASAIRKIQRSGRTGRKAPGKIVVLIAKDTKDEAFYWSSKKKEKKMKQHLEDLAKDEELLSKETQKTLEEYASKPEKPIVYVDQRERSSGITRELMGKDIEIKPVQLPVADFLVSDRTAVERKSASDFVTSIIDGRLFSQAKEIRENFKKPIMVIEGGDLYAQRNVHPNAIRGAIASIAVDFEIPLVYTEDTEDTAEFIVTLAKREQKEKNRLVRLRGDKKTLTDRQEQIMIVESLPGVGPKLARDLLKHFKTIKKLVNASKQQLREVEGIGDKKALNILKVIKREFE